MSTSADLVYVQEPGAPLDVPEVLGGAAFHHLGSWLGAWRARRHVRAMLSDGEALAGALRRLAVPGLYTYFYVLDAGRVVHSGRMRVTRTGVAPLEGAGVVIGPLRTHAEHRGRGIGTFAVRHAINLMLARGHRRFYMSVAESNAASRRMVEKAGFGAPAARRTR